MDVEAVIDRIMRLEGLRYRTEVAAKLGADKAAVTRWTKQGNIPNQYLLDYCEDRQVTLDWLVLGIGEPDRSDRVFQRFPGLDRAREKQEAIFIAAERLYAACGMADTQLAPAGFKLLLRQLAAMVLADVSITDDMIQTLISEVLRAQHQSADPKFKKPKG